MLLEIKIAVVVFLIIPFIALALVALIWATNPPREGEICEDTCEKLRKEWLLKSCVELALLEAEIHSVKTMDA